MRVYFGQPKKENVHRGAHALTGLMFAPSVIMFSKAQPGGVLKVLKHPP